MLTVTLDRDEDIVAMVVDEFSRQDIQIGKVTLRRFPGEIIVVVEANESNFKPAVAFASNFDDKIPNGFITVRKVANLKSSRSSGRKLGSLADSRVNNLIEILNSRSRTSEKQPSLRYFPDSAQTIAVAISRRHHLIFGRRGVGKTALMLEAKRIIENRGSSVFWINVQTLRSLNALAAFLTTAGRLCELCVVSLERRNKSPRNLLKANNLYEKIQKILNSRNLSIGDIGLLIPELQELLKFTAEISQQDLYVFLDDFHYLGINEQPKFLDMLHAITRDNPVWIKAAAIRHQSRWFTDNPPTGLQTGHDAVEINLDVTLEQPSRARVFLTNILTSYAEESQLARVTDVISGPAIDRLVLASGGVPRDFLVLGAAAIEVARQRANAKIVGIQDVNEAAGKIAGVKIQELEEDAASSVGKADSRRATLTALKRFLLDDKHVTFFRIDFRDKETRQEEYELLQSLMDLRLIHLIHASLSDEHHGGQRSEVYMLDLSQFSATRFRRKLRVLDFTKNHLVLKSTGGGDEPRKGDTPKKLQGILRRGPLFQLEALHIAENVGK